jgi:hypothetical protein
VKPQPTPGFWRVGDAGRTVFGPKTEWPSPETIADVRPGEHMRANAWLLAAAPRLLDVCKLAENWLNELDGGGDDELLIDLRTAIRIAEEWA